MDNTNDFSGSIYDPIAVFKNTVAANQKSAAGRNLERVAGIKDKWRQQFEANQRSVDMGVDLSYPEYAKAPLKEVVNEYNETTWVPFTDLTPPPMPTKTLPAPGVNTGGANNPLFSTGAGIQDAAMLAALGRIEQKLDKLTAALSSALVRPA